MLIAILFSILCSSANAYHWRTCGGHSQIWRSHNLHFKIQDSSFPLNSAERATVVRALNTWNGQNANIDISFEQGYDATISTGDSQNDIFFTSIDGNNTLAQTHSRWRCCWFFGWRTGYRSSDIFFNTQFLWATSIPRTVREWMTPPIVEDQPAYNIEQTALHEIGHAIGLLHDNRTHALMNETYPHAGSPQMRITPHFDDVEGARRLYGNDETHIDLAAWAIDAYSTSSDPDGTYARVTLNPTKMTVTRGNTYSFTHGIENLGNVAANNVPVVWYLSQDNIISTSDVPLSAYSVWNDLLTFNKSTVAHKIPPQLIT
ncbi:MAG: hypothetical protein CUN55_16075, partial [Phototrophicales bacterium]